MGPRKALGNSDREPASKFSYDPVSMDCVRFSGERRHQGGASAFDPARTL